ncbi:MAG: efflux transporter outer membrane subunit [Desulfobacteraceae bacterium]|nr:efflux transporter outer membrane subunit [Desulfobacteraceae bacterium]
MYTGKGDTRTDRIRTIRWEGSVNPLKPSSLVWLAMVLIMSGCTMVGPDFVKPEAPLRDAWTEIDAPGLGAGQTDYNDWWGVFDDPVLDNLVESAYRQNLSLQIAGIRIYEARAQLGIAVGNLYPQQQSASGALTANKISLGDNLPSFDNYFNSLSLGFDAAWELDVWGKFRRSVQSGVANLEATVASYDNVLVSLTAEVARSYIVIRTLEKRLTIAQENVRLQAQSLYVADVRFKEGAVSELDVTQARMLLADTQALVPQLASGLRQAQNALAILLGVLPGEVKEMLSGPSEIPVAAEGVIVDLPNNLLRRRPDIRLTELRIAAQSPQIGIAKADLYPHFTLFGTIGWRSSDATSVAGENSLGDIFSQKSLFWSAGPGFNWDILNYGRIRNRVRVEDARLQQLVVAYKNAVLNAQREVEDAMVAYTQGKDEEALLKESVAAARRSVSISSLQYKEGLVDYQRVLDSQRFLAVQADRLTEVSGQVSSSLVALYKALGGGWQIREGKEILSTDNKNAMTDRTSWGGLLGPEGLALPVDEKDRRDWQMPDW